MTVNNESNLAQYIGQRQSARGGGPVYMPYLTVGDPDFDSTVQFAVQMIDAGADILELGIPFSDPTADGPVIQAAIVRALGHPDFSMRRVFSVAKAIHTQRPEVPLVFLSYMNPVLNGLNPAPRINFQARPEDADRLMYDTAAALDSFLQQCVESGVQALVIPDLPFDQPEAILIRERLERYGVHQILMVAPNTSDERLNRICEAASGFIYYVTSLGVTGIRKDLQLPADLKSRIARIRERSGVPVMAGFGINTPGQIEPLRGVVDGIIVGSLHHRIIGELGASAAGQLVDATAGFVAACNQS
ncbi:MAG: tryptophan synthase subunit alpha [Leptospiraceae bacterium]|nr:tryptophan synthase subunit alpha [Leptospiraceae bacterium]MCB1323444.1 tryptophan synthase subunit alpha [Leptospiraceae bacterium]